jgi:hypothetical protein
LERAAEQRQQQRRAELGVSNDYQGEAEGIGAGGSIDSDDDNPFLSFSNDHSYDADSEGLPPHPITTGRQLLRLNREKKIVPRTVNGFNKAGKRFIHGCRMLSWVSPWMTANVQSSERAMLKLSAWMVYKQFPTSFVVAVNDVPNSLNKGFSPQARNDLTLYFRPLS